MRAMKISGACAPRYQPWLGRLETLFERMDEAYGSVSGRYGFHCRGCDDNCCRTRFHHHTLLEFLLLAEGFRRLDAKLRWELKAAAAEVCREYRNGAPAGARPLCPLNAGGLCRLYRCRPMICRLHGVPHEMRRPTGGRVHGPGCGAFEARCGSRSPFRLDRTPFYTEMADLERHLRQALGVTEKIKMTVAEMLLRFEDDRGSSSPPPGKAFENHEIR